VLRQTRATLLFVAMASAAACAGRVESSEDDSDAAGGASSGGAGGTGNTAATGGAATAGLGNTGCTLPLGGAGSGGTASTPVPPAGKYTGDPRIELHDGQTCERELLPARLPIADGECSRDADCVSTPRGQCIGVFFHECKPPTGFSDPSYERGLPCETITRQTETVEPNCNGGECFQLIFTRCAYDQCVSDSECPGERCSCDPYGNRCVPAGCYADADCQPGERCEAFHSICHPEIGGYACTTPSDTCEPDDSCNDGGGWCMPFDTDQWRCVNHTCR
jgi:hypothetical protein